LKKSNRAKHDVINIKVKTIVSMRQACICIRWKREGINRADKKKKKSARQSYLTAVSINPTPNHFGLIKHTIEKPEYIGEKRKYFFFFHWFYKAKNGDAEGEQTDKKKEKRNGNKQNTKCSEVYTKNLFMINADNDGTHAYKLRSQSRVG
jgi:hypothetical protein